MNQEEKGSDRELFEYGIELRNSNKMSTLKYKSGAQKEKWNYSKFWGYEFYQNSWVFFTSEQISSSNFGN